MAYKFNPFTGKLDSVNPYGTIQVGTVTKLLPSDNPTVTNTGTAQDAIFNFGIPQGDAGVVSAAGAGTAAAPSISFAGDLNTGIYNPAADTLAWSTGGSERARIDSAGRVGIGTSPSKTLDVAGDAKIVTTSTTQNILLGVSSGGIGYKTQVDFGHPTVGARIESERLGANTQSSLSLWTTSSAGVIRRALTIDQEQYVRLASGTGGIQFNGDTAAANALDDYEEGTFTPSLTFGGGSTGLTYALRRGDFTKIGRKVHVIIEILLSAKGSSTGTASISGLPFVSANKTFGATVNACGSVAFANGYLNAGVNANATTITLYNTPTSGGVITLSDTAFTNTSGMRIDATYYV